MSIRRAPMSPWSKQPLSKFTRSSPNLRLIDAVLKVSFGSFFNGCYGVRPIRGGSSYSIHSWGAAIDSSFRNSSRAKLLQAIDWLIANSEELNIESIHDYGGSRIWHAERSTPQDTSAGGGGWKAFHGSGTPNGDWIHYETTLAGWGNETPIGLRPGLVMPGATAAAPLGPCKCDEIEKAAEPEWPAFNPGAGQFALWPLNKNKPVIKLGVERTPETNDATLYLQGVLKKQGFKVAVDGNFGAQTESFVKFCQGTWGLKQDGVVGNQTWAKFDEASAA